jgi:hypothetical protein
LDDAEKWREIRIFHATELLDESPDCRIAVMTMQGPGDYIIVTIAIRGTGAGELHIPIKKYEPWALVDLINKHEGREHGVPSIN